MRIAILWGAVTLCLSSLISAAPSLIKSGPMLGHVTDSQAAIWISVKKGAIIEVDVSQGDEKGKEVGRTDLGGGYFILNLGSLKPAQQTRVNLRVKTEGGGSELQRLQFRTMPVPAKTGKVRVAFGSCSKLSQYPRGPIYHAIAKEQPDAMLFLGDNSYFIVADGSDRHFSTTGPVGDWSSEEGMMMRHLVTRNNRDMQPLLRLVPNYGIWDDHDYGPNNADREFELRDEALAAFRRMWANPGWGTKEAPGIFSSFRVGPAEVFLMDDRYYKYSPQRHKDVTTQTGIIWGEAQLAWLLEKLEASTAPVKLIANGTQVISSEMIGEGHFQEARQERQKLLDFLAEKRIGGVMFLSGDRHSSEAMQLAQPDGTLLVEGTSSPLQQDQRIGPFPRSHDNQLWSMRGNNYGLVTIDIPESGEGGTVHFETRDETNETAVVYEKDRATTWTLDQLNYGEGEGDANAPQTWDLLFNGRDLSGWTQKNGTATYRVAGGAIVGKTAEGSPNSFLCTEKEYENFELKFEVRVDDALNSGVQIRSQSKPDFKDGRVHGPQIEIEASPGNSGYVYSEGTGKGWISQSRTKSVFRNGSWNLYHVRAEGKRIRTWVNGIKVADVSNEESPLKGFIGLQVHGIPKGTGPYEVHWRNLSLKEL